MALVLVELFEELVQLGHLDLSLAQLQSEFNLNIINNKNNKYCSTQISHTCKDIFVGVETCLGSHLS